ncbi:virion core protein P4a [Cheloniid poxvirus 1]|nr:virion core protein P4a [Cheloniid poxvirus 1]
MMLINNIVTLDQLESSDYLYKLLVSVLPSLCFDYKIDPKLMKGYIHGFDTIVSSSLGSLSFLPEITDQLSTLGINYLLSRRYNLALYFPVSILNNGEILSTWNGDTGGYVNPIPCKISFNDLPPFTKVLMKIRTTGCEGHARYFGGYVKHPSAPNILSPNINPNISFPNTYIATLTYPDTIKNAMMHSSYKPLIINGVMLRKDLINLLNIRALLSPTSRNVFDILYNLEFHANANNIAFIRNPTIDTELLTMPLKYLVMFYQHFSNFTLGDLYFGGNLLHAGDNMLSGYVTSIYFKDTIKYIEDNNLFNLVYSDRFIFRVGNSNRYITITDRDISARILDMSVDSSYIITLLSIVSKSMNRNAIVPSEMSLFWDGMSYDEYKNLKFGDMMFLGATCYLFALYNESGTTYCSMLTDVLSAGRTPTRVCVLPRTIKNKTIPTLISEILESINNMTPRDFPKYDTRDIKHIGLSDAGFMLFFQFLRLVENKEPHVAIKEILMAYVGIKIDDKGSPYLITPESYRTFIFMLFKAMGFNVRVNRTIVSSHTYTSYNVSPRVTKRYLVSMLQKASCSEKEAEKLLSSAHDLVSFMLAVNNSSNRDGYRRMNRSFMGGSKQNVTDEEDYTLVQFISPVNILDRINVKGILAATSVNELLDTDVFLPENINFRNNLRQLLEEDIIDGKSIAHIIPLNMLDRFIISAGASVSVVDVLDSIDERVPDENATNEVIDLITNALKESHVNDSTFLATNILNSIIPLSEKQMDGIKKITCHGNVMFKELALYIYIIEKHLKAKISDDIKISILEKYRDFIELSKSLYRDLIAIDQIKSVLKIIRRTGRNIDESSISQEDLQKAYNIAKPKILKLSNQYNDMTKSVFENIRTMLNPDDSGAIVFDNE